MPKKTITLTGKKECEAFKWIYCTALAELETLPKTGSKAIKDGYRGTLRATRALKRFFKDA